MGDGFFMQITSQQPFSYNCIIACFPWYFPEQSGKVILFSVIFHPIFSGFYLFQTFRWAISLSYPIYIRLFIRVTVIWAVQSNLYVISSLFLLQNLFLLLRFLTLFNPTVARAYSLDFAAHITGLCFLF